MNDRFMWVAAMLAPLLAACNASDAAPERGATPDTPAAVAAAAPAPAPIGEPTSTTASPPTALLPIPQPTGERQIGVRLTEFRIELTRSQISAGEVEFHVVNAGKVEHDFVVRSGSVYALTEHLEPGDSTVLTVHLPPGEHRYLCGIRDDRDHHASGMDGAILAL